MAVEVQSIRRVASNDVYTIPVTGDARDLFPAFARDVDIFMLIDDHSVGTVKAGDG